MFKRRIGLLIAAGAALILITAACGDVSIRIGQDDVGGSGRIVSETRSVPDFDRVILAGEGEVIIVPADSPSLVIETDDNLHTHIEVFVSGDTLTIRTEEDVDINPTHGVLYHVGIPELSGVELLGAGSFDVDGWDSSRLEVVLAGAGNVNIDDLTAELLDVRIPGAGSVSVSGRTDSQTVVISGAGRYEAADLSSLDADITSTGVGNATLWVEDHLAIDSNGVGNVSYYGEPEVTQRITGLGSVRSLGPR